ncbi:hypothetical protein MJ561_05980 [Klebsiella pneumoniae]|nr:hypothetical protein MJ561_05980 [Klebsiella pneumoniae]
MTAQHQDDQCETLLLALKRGSGPTTACRRWRHPLPLPGSRLLRPLLNENLRITTPVGARPSAVGSKMRVIRMTRRPQFPAPAGDPGAARALAAL